jgi:hypothetical protein
LGRGKEPTVVVKIWMELMFVFVAATSEGMRNREIGFVSEA